MATNHLSLRGPQTPPARHLPDYLGVWYNFQGYCGCFRNPARKPVEGTVVYRFIPLFTAVSYILLVVGLGISEPSTVCQPSEANSSINHGISTLLPGHQERSQSLRWWDVRSRQAGMGLELGKFFRSFRRFPMPNGFRGQVFRTWL